MLTVRQFSNDGGLTWRLYDETGTLQPFRWTSEGSPEHRESYEPGWATLNGLVYVGAAGTDPVHGELHRLRWTSSDGRKVVNVLARIVQQILA